MGKASACGWQMRNANTVPPDHATAQLGQGYGGFSKKYLYFYARAIAAILLCFEQSVADAAARFGLPFALPAALFLYATSYPFLKKALDITSLRGNAPGVDGLTYYLWAQIPTFLDTPLRQLRALLRRGIWWPGRLRRVEILKGNGKTRIIYILNLIDRVVERAIALVLVPIFETFFHSASFGFRPGLSVADAYRTVVRLCHFHDRYFVGKADLKDAFDCVPQNNLLDIVRLVIKDRRLTDLIERIVKRPGWRNKRGKRNIGLPQGGPLAPVLFNLYLDHFLDQVLATQYPDVAFVRWADDILLICRDEAQLRLHRALVEKLLKAAGLAVNHEKNDMADLRRGEELEYLGLTMDMDNDGSLRIGLGEDALVALYDQLKLDLAGQHPRVSWEGRRSFLSNQAIFTIRSWLEAYSGGIPESDWPEIRRLIKSLFLGNPPRVFSGSSPFIQSLPLECPSTEALDGAYQMARCHWHARFYSTNPSSIWSRIVKTRRDATALCSTRQTEPDYVADGADMFAAPSVHVEPYEDKKPGPEEVEWRVRFAPLQ